MAKEPTYLGLDVKKLAGPLDQPPPALAGEVVVHVKTGLSSNRLEKLDDESWFNTLPLYRLTSLQVALNPALRLPVRGPWPGRGCSAEVPKTCKMTRSCGHLPRKPRRPETCHSFNPLNSMAKSINCADASAEGQAKISLKVKKAATCKEIMALAPLWTRARSSLQRPASLVRLPRGEPCLCSNSLTVSLPKALRLAEELTYLDLDANMLAGPLLADVGNLRKLQTLWLKGNKFSGASLEGLWRLLAARPSHAAARASACMTPHASRNSI